MAQILVVEDNPDNMTLFQAVLRMGGHEIIGLPDGERLLATLDAGIPDLILLDIQLPGRDGFTLHAEVRRHLGSRCPRVVALTAHAMQGDRDRAMEAGFDGYITKPIVVQAFCREVEAFLR